MIAFTVLGLPAHPLIVHVTVVGIPLASLGTIAYVLRPAIRAQLLWPLIVTVAVAWVSAILAGSTGETLEHGLHHSHFIEDHARWADRLGLAMHVLGASALIALLTDAWRARREAGVPSVLRTLRSVALPVAAVSALACLGLVGVVGHLGARAAWHDSPAASASMRAER
ncbi:MAG: hypothetical protein JWM98_3105 [Thermoleophilia bacterium]|nr:hypothetical protein [Thermoleophilia bacterium]